MGDTVDDLLVAIHKARGGESDANDENKRRGEIAEFLAKPVSSLVTLNLASKYVKAEKEHHRAMDKLHDKHPHAGMDFDYSSNGELRQIKIMGADKQTIILEGDNEELKEIARLKKEEKAARRELAGQLMIDNWEGPQIIGDRVLYAVDMFKTLERQGQLKKYHEKAEAEGRSKDEGQAKDEGEPFKFKSVRYKDMSSVGKEQYDAFKRGIEGASAIIGGKEVNIRFTADFERAIMDMVGIKGITAEYPRSVTTSPIDKDAKVQVMEIAGIREDDYKQLVRALRAEDMRITQSFDRRTGVATITMHTSEMMDKLTPKLKDELEKLGKDNPELLRELQGQSKTTEEKYQEAAARLQKVFGAEVKVSRVRDFNGVPTFEIKAGTSKQEAEAAIDRLIEARKAAGLTKENLTLGSDDNGSIRIHGGLIMNYGQGKFDVIDSTFEKLEDPKNAKAFKEAIHKKETASLDLEKTVQPVSLESYVKTMPRLTGSEMLGFSDPENPNVPNGGGRRALS